MTRTAVVARYDGPGTGREQVRIGILLFDDVDVMDVAGPYEVFLTAARLQERRGEPPTFEVTTISPAGRAVTAYGGIGLAGGSAAPDVDRLDVLVVPGAIAIDEVGARADVLDAITRLAGAAGVVASVCTGAFLLERAGLLDGRQATTHWEDAGALGRRIGPGRVRDDVRWVDDGAIVTSGGLSSGIAMALHLVERFAGRDLAEATARQIDYVWTERR
jgi:transcriptional regulator GlxA family with amidase domain